MERLRHPIRAIREPFGTAGLVVACIALIAALAGGAYAATGLNGKQKKEVKTIAKQFAGKPGSPGAVGPAGPQGAKGDTGAAGANGSDGADGVSVASEEFTGTKEGKCAGQGGVKFTSASGSSFACNGKQGIEGEPWTAGGTLPTDATETGTFGGPIAAGGFALVPVSLTLPTEQPLEGIYVTGGKEFNEENLEVTEDKCPGLVGGIPTAEPGALCVYPGLTSGTVEYQGLFSPIQGTPTPGVATTGTLVGVVNSGVGEGAIGGVYAATAE